MQNMIDGLVPAEIIASLGAIKASSLRIDLSIGKYDSGFTTLMRPNTNGGQDAGIFDFSQIDRLADGLIEQKVQPLHQRPDRPVLLAVLLTETSGMN